MTPYLSKKLTPLSCKLTPSKTKRSVVYKKKKDLILGFTAALDFSWGNWVAVALMGWGVIWWGKTTVANLLIKKSSKQQTFH